jgi:hypothetical protein
VGELAGQGCASGAGADDDDISFELSHRMPP